MWNERTYYHPEYPIDHLTEYDYGRHSRYPDPAADYYTVLEEPSCPAWDPAEELAYILQGTAAQGLPPSHPVYVQAPLTEAAVDPPPPLDVPQAGPPVPPPRQDAGGHRRNRTRVRGPVRVRVYAVRSASCAIAVLVALLASAVSFFSTAVAYDPLRLIAASHAGDGPVAWWPALVHGPWLVASLSVLRAALHQRRAVHSWCVLAVFTLIAMLLCVARAPRDIVGITAALLPGLASLACLQQLVRQVTLTRPPRRAVPRHRLPQPVPLTDPPTTGPRITPGVPRPRGAGHTV